MKADKTNPIFIKRYGLGMTRQELAEKGSVDLETIKRIETGITPLQNAKLTTLMNLAKALNCKVRDFFPNEKCI